MRRIMTATLVTAALLVAASTAQARKPSGGQSHSSGSGNFKNNSTIRTTNVQQSLNKTNIGKLNPVKNQQSNLKNLNDQKKFQSNSKGNGSKFLDKNKQQYGNKKFFNKGYCNDYGKKFSCGYVYSGKHHCHWSHYCYCPKYSCCCYWCPSACGWYYWCEPRCCYLPYTCVEYAQPVAVASAVPTTTIINTATAGPGSPVVSSAGAPTDLPPIMPPAQNGAPGPIQPFKMQ